MYLETNISLREYPDGSFELRDILAQTYVRFTLDDVALLRDPMSDCLSASVEVTIDERGYSIYSVDFPEQSVFLSYETYAELQLYFI